MIAVTVRQQLRSVDILARYGGDEFVLVLPETAAGGAMNTVEKIRRVIEGTAMPGGLPSSPGRKFTVSVGLSVYTESSASAQELLQQADQSLLRAKMAGRNTTLLWTHDLIPAERHAGFSSTVNT